jgi:FkbM family methyltransferase
LRHVVALDRLKVALTRSPRLYDAARRPYGLARYYARRPHDRDYAAFGLFPQTERPFLDVGANAGQSAFSFRIHQRHAPIISIEPNPFHERDLRFAGRFVKPFSFHICAAGEADDELTLYVPVYRGVPMTTEASLDRDAAANSPSLLARLPETTGLVIEERTVPVMPLDSLGLDPAFVKLDVQGYDEPAIAGLRATIERSRPVLMIESPSQATHALLKDLGYQPRTYDAAQNSIEHARWPAVNVFYVPTD